LSETRTIAACAFQNAGSGLFAHIRSHLYKSHSLLLQ